MVRFFYFYAQPSLIYSSRTRASFASVDFFHNYCFDLLANYYSLDLVFMNFIYRHLIRPVLFQMQAEQAHEKAIHLLRVVLRYKSLSDFISHLFSSPLLPTTIENLHFSNPLGLAAGMDKNAVALPVWQKLGFGFCEIGGITGQEQPGNPKPRMFRAPKDQSIINRMGFNNDGLEKVLETLKDWKTCNQWPSSPVAINLGKSKTTPLDEAPQEYAQLLESLWAYGDFFVVNVSSPNTPDLRKLQHIDALKKVFQALNHSITKLEDAYPNTPRRPIFLKIDPDMSKENLDDIIDTVLESGISGIVATNTTLSRPAPERQGNHPDVYAEKGGMSGKPLQQRSTDLIRHIYSRTTGKLAIIGVGGIFKAEDAWEKIAAGATLIQAYSGMVYEGPGMARSIVEGLSEQLEIHGLNSIEEAVGKELPYISMD